MPRRKIGADLKEALCKLYEAGDISADTIEKHGIMSRATFFRNLKMYKSGGSLEQRHSTGRKTNADKLKQQDRQQLDALQPAHLSHLELVLLLDDEHPNAQTPALRNKRKAKGSLAGSKKKDAAKTSAGDNPTNDTAQGEDDSASESDGEIDESAAVAHDQEFDRLWQATRSFLASTNNKSGSSSSSSSSSPTDLDLLSKPEDSHYSHGNRGALFVVRRKGKDAMSDIVAAVALRSLIWTPEIYQALGPTYANRSIDKIGNLARLHVDSAWRRKGVGRWLVRVAELKASKLGFSQLYTQSDTNDTELLSFWQATGFHEFARLHSVARLEKAVMVVATAATPSGADTSKRRARSPPVLSQTDPVADDPGSASTSKQRRIDASPSQVSQPASAGYPANPQALQIDPAIPLDPSLGVPSSSALSTSASGAMLADSAALSNSSRPSDAASASVFSVDTSGPIPAPIQTSSATLTAAIPVHTSPEPSQLTSEPPLRKIAFHDSSATTSHPCN